MGKKNITINDVAASVNGLTNNVFQLATSLDELAGIIKNGFDKVNEIMKTGFKKMNKRLDRIEAQIESIEQIIN